MSANYPRDRIACRNKDGPTDPRFRIPGGTLIYKQYHDARFPYLYTILMHALVHLPKYIKEILIHIIDTLVDDRKACANFGKRLSIPLGLNVLMEKYGELH